MGSGSSALEVHRPLERRMSTVSASPSTTVVTNAPSTLKKPLMANVFSVSSNAKINFLSSVGGVEDRASLGSPLGFGVETKGKYMVQLGEYSPTLQHTFPSLDEAREMSINELCISRAPFGVPVNFSFGAVGGQSAAVRCISCTPDGSQHAVVCNGKTSCDVFDTTGNLILTIRGSGEQIVGCAISKDARFVLTTSGALASLWDLTNGKRLREIPQPEQVCLAVVTDESDAILTALCDHSVVVWDVKTCDRVSVFTQHSSSICSMAISRKGQWAATGGVDGELFVWNYATSQLRFRLERHALPITSVSFSTNFKRLCSVDRENLIVWDLFLGTVTFIRNTDGDIRFGPLAAPFSNCDSARFTGCVFGGANVVVATTSSKQNYVVDPNLGTELLALPTKGIVTAIAASWNGDILQMGDNLGNIYRLQMYFSAKDAVTFNLLSTPLSKEKGKFD